MANVRTHALTKKATPQAHIDVKIRVRVNIRNLITVGSRPATKKQNQYHSVILKLQATVHIKKQIALSFTIVAKQSQIGLAMSISTKPYCAFSRERIRRSVSLRNPYIMFGIMNTDVTLFSLDHVVIIGTLFFLYVNGLNSKLCV